MTCKKRKNSDPNIFFQIMELPMLTNIQLWIDIRLWGENFAILHIKIVKHSSGRTSVFSYNTRHKQIKLSVSFTTNF